MVIIILAGFFHFKKSSFCKQLRAFHGANGSTSSMQKSSVSSKLKYRLIVCDSNNAKMKNNDE